MGFQWDSSGIPMGFQWDSNSVGFQKTKTWDSTWDSVQQSVGFQMGFRQSNGHICYPVLSPLGDSSILHKFSLKLRHIFTTDQK